jgi:hypothetical protein
MRRFATGRRRHTPGQMNKTELRYATTLEDHKRQGLVEWYSFEAIKLKLADKTFYTPDFFVMRPDGTLECHEVKGFWEDDARVKIKCAAEKFPFKFIAIKPVRTGYEIEEI